MNPVMAETITARSRAQVARFFDGLELAEPGLVRITQWRSGPAWGRLAPPRCGRGWPASPASGG